MELKRYLQAETELSKLAQKQSSLIHRQSMAPRLDPAYKKIGLGLQRLGDAAAGEGVSTAISRGINVSLPTIAPFFLVKFTVANCHRATQGTSSVSCCINPQGDSY